MKFEDIFAPTAHDLTFEDVEHAVAGLKKGAGGWIGFCPAHEDRNNPSLKIDIKSDGFVALRCYAGCTQEAVLYAIKPELEMIPLEEAIRPDFAEEVARRKAAREAELADREVEKVNYVLVKTYDYNDEDGNLLYQVCRYNPKHFSQRQPNPLHPSRWIDNMNGARRVLYRLPELLASEHSQPVFLVEGEKDADTLWEQGLIATTNVGGAVNWLDTYNETLYNRSIVIVEDNDKAGRMRTEKLMASLSPYAESIKVIQMPSVREHYDVTDFFEDGGDVNALLGMVDDAQTESSNPQEVIADVIDEDDDDELPPLPAEKSVESETEPEEEINESEEEEEDTSEEDFEEAFTKRMAEIEEILETEGELAGLCEICFGTDIVHGYIGHNLGVVYEPLGETKQLMICDHGKGPTSGSTLF